MKEKKFNIKNKDKAKNIIIIILVLSIAIGYPVMYNLGKIKTTKLLDKARSALSKTSDMLDEARVELVNKLSLLATKEEIIKNYEARETINTVVVSARDINAQLFKEVEVEISLNKEYPGAIFDDKYALDSDIFGNFVEIKDKINVLYFYGSFTNKINIENVNDEKVEISYKSSSFMNPPYRIQSRDTSLNLGGYLMTNSKDDEIYKLINTVGINQLSDIEDAFIEKLKKEYQDSTIPIYVNGVLLNDWTEENKIIKEESIDGMCTVKIIE